MDIAPQDGPKDHKNTEGDGQKHESGLEHENHRPSFFNQRKDLSSAPFARESLVLLEKTCMQKAAVDVAVLALSSP